MLGGRREGRNVSGAWEGRVWRGGWVRRGGLVEGIREEEGAGCSGRPRRGGIRTLLRLLGRRRRKGIRRVELVHGGNRGKGTVLSGEGEGSFGRR